MSLSIRAAPFYDESVLSRDVGIRPNGVETINVYEWDSGCARALRWRGAVQVSFLGVG